jgi:PTS system nitrogen regulatory IIA component
MKMRDLLSIVQVVPNLRARDKRDALRQLAAHAASDKPVAADAILRSVLAGAELPAFGPRAGIALPHAFVPGLRNPAVTFAKLEPAVEFGAVDGSKTDLVALLLSPADNAGDHLRALACIARTLRNPTMRNLLRAANSRDSIYAILCEGEQDQYGLREPSLDERAPPSQQKHR